jgi:hypothetical protein
MATWSGMAAAQSRKSPIRSRSACIGVTGHRHLTGAIDWDERIAEALNLIQAKLAPAGGTPIAWSVISSLAEGADRLVAEAILHLPGSLLEVPLPLPRHEYLADFKSDESKATFTKFLDQAWMIICAPRFGSREAAALTHHFEFRRQRETSESMMRRLRHASDVVARAPTLPALRREAEAAERLMMTENRD